MLVRMLKRCCPWAVILVGGLFFLGGLASLASETAPTSVSIVDLESGQVIHSRYLHVSDGVVYWAKWVTYKKWRRDSGEVVARMGHYVPLVSSETAARWDSLPEDARVTEPSRVVFIWFSDDAFRSSFPRVVAEGPSATVMPRAVTGRVSSNLLLPPGFRDQVAQEVGIASQDSLILKDGELPLARGEAASMSIVGLGLVAGGWWWRRSDIKKAHGRMAIEAQVMAGAAEGAAAGFAAAIAQGLQDAVSRAQAGDSVPPGDDARGVDGERE